MSKQKAVFIDKDGTLIEDVPYNVEVEKIRLMPRAAAGLRMLHQADYRLFVVSNQSGVARGYFPESALHAVRDRLRALLAHAAVPLAGFYYCPHHPAGAVAEYAVACACRKPAPGMIKQAEKEHDIDLQQSWLIGDILDDIEAGRQAQCKTILLDNGHETEWVLTSQRMPDFVAADLEEAAGIITSLPSVTDGWGTVNAFVAGSLGQR